MYKAKYINPMIPLNNLKETGLFFMDVLSFSPLMDTNQYAVYVKDNLAIHLLPAGENICQMEFYLEVDNVDDLWTSIKDKVGRIKSKRAFIPSLANEF
jgi:hypothetical protein